MPSSGYSDGSGRAPAAPSRYYIEAVLRSRRLDRCHGPGVVAGSGTMQISNIMDAISIFIHITHECMDSKKLIMWSHTEKNYTV